MSTKEELSKRAFEALAKGDDAAVEAIKAEIAALQTRYNNDRDSEVTSIVAQVIRGEVLWDDVEAELQVLVDETVEYGSAAEVRLTAEVAGERARGARALAELEERLTTERERADIQLRTEVESRTRFAELLTAERAVSTKLAADLAAELAKRPAPATEAVPAETAPASRS